MVNNYIKDGHLPRAEGKRYSKAHLAYLTELCALKTVLPVREAGSFFCVPLLTFPVFLLKKGDDALAGQLVGIAFWSRGRMCWSWPSLQASPPPANPLRSPRPSSQNDTRNGSFWW